MGTRVMKDPMRASAWLQKLLFTSSTGVDFFELLKAMANRDKAQGNDLNSGLAAGLFRRVFGMEAGTGGLAMVLQDIDAWLAKGRNAVSDEASGGKTPMQSWDDAMTTRLESFASKMDQIAARAGASFDEMFRQAEGPIKGLADATSNLLTNFITASDGVKQFGGAALAVASALGMYSMYSVGRRWLGGGPVSGVIGGATAGALTGEAAAAAAKAGGSGMYRAGAAVAAAKAGARASMGAIAPWLGADRLGVCCRGTAGRY